MGYCDFKRDKEVYGDFGEDYFANLYKSNGYDVLDVSGCRAFQDADIDFVINKERVQVDLNNPTSVSDLINSLDRTSRGDKKVEVKTDGRSFDTGNIIYEVKNENVATGVIRDGWALKCKADYLYYIFVTEHGDKNKPLLNIEEVWVVDFNLWKLFIDKFSKKDIRKKYGIFENVYNSEEKNRNGIVNLHLITNFLCKIKKMEHYYYDTEKNDFVCVSDVSNFDKPNNYIRLARKVTNNQ